MIMELTVDVTALRIGDVITDAVDMGPVRWTREISATYGRELTPGMAVKVYCERETDVFCAPQRVKVRRACRHGADASRDYCDCDMITQEAEDQG